MYMAGSYGFENRNRWSKLYPIMCLALLATAPAAFLGEGNRNLGLIAFMLISPLFMLRRTPSTEAVLLLGFAFSIVLFPAFIHAGSTRWSTILYTLMFCALFISYDGMLRGGFLRVSVFVNCMRYLILAYTGVLLTQQLCVLVGFPIFNISNYNPSEPWKLNSLSAEPSHSARILGILMLSYILGNRIETFAYARTNFSSKQNILIWLCFLWAMITMISATSVVMIAIVLITYIQKNNFRYYIMGSLIAVGAFLVMPDQLTGRVTNLFFAVLTFDYAEALRADHSGAMRVAPMLVLLNYIEIFSMQGLFGNGVDSVGLFLSDHIWGVREGTTGGGLLALWYEYGLISFAFFVLFTLKATAATKAPANFLTWFILIFIAGVNTQLVWLAIILLYTLNVYRQRAERARRHGYG